MGADSTRRTTPCLRRKRFHVVGLPVAVRLWALGVGAGVLSCPTSSSSDEDVAYSIRVRPSHSMLTFIFVFYLFKPCLFAMSC